MRMQCPLWVKVDMCSAQVDVRLVTKADITALLDHIVSQEQKGFAYRQAETFGRFKKAHRCL